MPLLCSKCKKELINLPIGAVCLGCSVELSESNFRYNIALEVINEYYTSTEHGKLRKVESLQKWLMLNKEKNNENNNIRR